MSFLGVPTSMTLNDLQPKNMGFSEFFIISGGDAHFEWIFAEITGDRLEQPAYKIKLILPCVSWALTQISSYTLPGRFLAKIHGNRRMRVYENNTHSSLTCPF